MGLEHIDIHGILDFENMGVVDRLDDNQDIQVNMVDIDYMDKVDIQLSPGNNFVE